MELSMSYRSLILKVHGIIKLTVLYFRVKDSKITPTSNNLLGHETNIG